uniref:Pentacotripeptide-repeat region of PRORP domain-containing protein n=1 Tax=Setaria italica TaxID=4555 RepID=A0A0Q3VA11_SETIT
FLRRLPHDASPHIFPHLVAALARSPRPILALRLFLSPPTPAATTHHSFNSALVRFPLPPHLLPAFFSHSLRRFPGLTPTLLSFNLLLKCISSSLVPRNPSIYLATALRILHDAIPVWNLAPDKFTYSTVVSALSDAGHVEDAVALVHEMVVDGVVAAEAFNPVLRAMLRAGDVNGAAKLFRFMQLKGCTLTAATYNVLLHGLLLCSKVKAAMGIMRRMENEGIVPGLMTYGAVVDGLVKCGRVEDAWKVAEEMGNKGLPPSEFVFSAVITGFCRSGEVDRALRVWETMVAATGLCMSGMVDGGLRLFNDMLAKGDAKPDAIIYNVVLDGLIRTNNLARAMDMLNQMLDQRCDPDAVTCNIFLREVGVAEAKGREFLEGLVMRLCNRERYRAAGDVLMVMLAKYIVPEAAIWHTFVRGVCQTKRVRKVVDNCWDEIWKP